jgi:transposase
MKKPAPPPREIELQELAAVLERAREVLSAADHEKLQLAVDTLAYLTQALAAKGTSLARLRRLLFGPRTEKTSQVLGAAATTVGSTATAGADAAVTAAAPAAGGNTRAPSTERRGHGRNGLAAYPAANKVCVDHQSLRAGERCPACGRGKLSQQRTPASLLRVTGLAPLQATVYELARLRCNRCGQVFTATAPPEVAGPKYDETAAAMIALLKYGSGLPFYRLQKLQKSLGIPLPVATQWEVVHGAAATLQPVYTELIRQAAQGEVLYNDDTTMKILALQEPEPEPQEGGKARTGVFTSGIVATVEGHQVAVFFTGRQHAGENLAQVLAERAKALAAPIQMCDALSRNTPGEFATIVANCLAHARRQFVDVASSFPDQCRHVLETLRDVYAHEELTRKQGLSDAARLAFHQEHSGPLMAGLKEWLAEQLDQHLVEPNSGLGQAIAYMQKHWAKLTLFLRQPGAPLDNNLCERALKKAILHRKNALFYKTPTGAHVGDLFMSLIHTAELCHADPFAYLVALQRHPRAITQSPAAWLPWNYQETAASLTAQSGRAG